MQPSPSHVVLGETAVLGDRGLEEGGEPPCPRPRQLLRDPRGFPVLLRVGRDVGERLPRFPGRPPRLPPRGVRVARRRELLRPEQCCRPIGEFEELGRRVPRARRSRRYQFEPRRRPKPMQLSGPPKASVEVREVELVTHRRRAVYGSGRRARACPGTSQESRGRPLGPGFGGPDRSPRLGGRRPITDRSPRRRGGRSGRHGPWGRGGFAPSGPPRELECCRRPGLHLQHGGRAYANATRLLQTVGDLRHPESEPPQANRPGDQHEPERRVGRKPVGRIDPTGATRRPMARDLPLEPEVFR